MRKNTNFILLSELFFFAALFVYETYYFLENSLYGSMISSADVNLLKYIALFILVFKWFLTKKITIKTLAFGILFLGVTVLVAVISNYTSLILIIALILSAQDVEYNRIVKFLIVSLTLWCVFIVISYKLGIIGEYVYLHRIGEKSVEVHSYGFNYYSTIGYVCMSVSIMFLYLRKKAKLWELAVIAVMNYFLYKVHTVRLVFFLVIAYVILYFLVENFKIIKLESKFWKFISAVLPTFMFIVTVAGALLYMFTGFLLPNIGGINTYTLNGRIIYTAQAFEKYGIHLFGSHVVQVGGYTTAHSNASSVKYFFIDSGYAYMLIAYGIVLTLLIMVMYTKLYWWTYMAGKKKLFLWLTVIIIANVVNDFFLGVLLNPVVFLIPSVVLNNKIKNTKVIEKEKLI